MDVGNYDLIILMEHHIIQHLEWQLVVGTLDSVVSYTLIWIPPTRQE